MDTSWGIGLSFVAMLCWGFGDFLIQRSTRKVGNWKTLFVITAFGALVLLPFVYNNLPLVFSGERNDILFFLFVMSAIALIAAGLAFEALRRGKISVVEPVWSLEIPTAVLLAFFVLGESLSFIQVILIFFLIIGLFSVSFQGEIFSARRVLERGIIISLLAAIIMGMANFFMGWGGRLSDPLMVNFFTNTFLAISSGAILLFQGKLSSTFRDLVHHRRLLLPMSIADNIAWITFVFAMSLAPIGVAVAISESYIIVAVILGLAISREKLELHQKTGLMLAITSAILLAAITV